MGVLHAAFIAGLAVAGGYDLVQRRIPNSLNVGLAALGLGVALVSGGIAQLGWAAAGLVCGLAVLYPLFCLRWFGAGDVKLAAAMGAWLGPALAAWTVLYGVAAGGVLAAIVAIAGGPALRAAVHRNLTIAAVTGSVPAIEPRRRRHQVPLAIPLAMSGAFHLLLGAPHAL